MSASPASSAVHIECAQWFPDVTVRGHLNASAAPVFDGETASLHNQHWARILLELSAIAYIGGEGLRSIFKIIERASFCLGRTGKFSVTESINELLEIPGMQPLLDIYPDREFALKEGIA